MTPEAPSGQKSLLLGRIHGAFGVRGELKLESFTDPVRGILRYQPWTLRRADGSESTIEGATGRETPKGLVATVPGIEDRDAAEALRGAELWVPRSALPPPKPGEYYWVDLEGLRVVNVEGVDFGTVSTVGLESSPLADAPAGLRANENKHAHDFTVKPASEAEATTEWIHRILIEERNIVITSHK